MKKLLCAIVIIALMLPTAVFAEANVNITINDKPLAAEGFISAEGRTMVPLRAIFEALGAKVDWDDETKTVSAQKGDTAISLTIGKGEIVKNGVASAIDTVPVIKNSSTFVPLRAVSEALGAKVDWVQETRTAQIKSAVADEKEDEFDGSFFTITLGGKFLTVEGDSKENGAQFTLCDTKTSDMQLWGFTAHGNNFYSITNKASAKSIDMPASDKTAGRAATLYTSNSGANQQLLMIKNDDGTYSLSFKHSELYLTYKDGKFSQEEKGEASTQCFKIDFVSESIMRAIKTTPGYAALDDKTRERFDSYVYETRAYTASIYNQTRALIEKSNYEALSATEQADVLKKCLGFTAFNLVYAGEVPKEGDTTYEITKKTFIESFDVWRGTKLPTWSYDVTMSDGYTMTMYTTVEDCSVVKDGISALARFPLGIRKHLKRLIHRMDDANNYNGGGDTIWIRLSFLPSENAIAQSLAHELGHVLDSRLTKDYALWDNARGDDMVPVSGYGNSNRAEDLAEFSRLYHMVKRDPALLEVLAKVYPARMSAYRALLYTADSEYYASFRADYEKTLPFDDADEEIQYVKISLDGTSNVLSLENDKTEGGTKVVLAPYEGKETQKWRIRTTKDGYKVIFNKGAADCCLNVPGNSTDVNKNLIIWAGGGGDNEKWTMTDGNVFCVKHSNLYLSFDASTAVQSQTQTKWTIENVD